MTAPRNRRRGEPRLDLVSETALPWVCVASVCLLLAALTPGWWSLGAVLVGLVAVVMLGILASERRGPSRPLEATAAPLDSQVFDRRTGLPVDEEGPWT